MRQRAIRNVVREGNVDGAVEVQGAAECGVGGGRRYPRFLSPPSPPRPAATTAVLVVTRTGNLEFIFLAMSSTLLFLFRGFVYIFV